MKKILILFLSVFLLLTFAACGDSTDGGSSAPDSSVADTSEDLSSDDTADQEEASTGLAVEYTSVADGYYAHTTKWEGKVVSLGGFKCMDGEVITIPAGSNIMCDSKMTVHCYKIEGEQLVLDIEKSKKVGQKVAENDTFQLSEGPFVFEEDAVCRFSVKGDLSDVQIYTPKEVEEKVKVVTPEKYIADFKAQ